MDIGVTQQQHCIAVFRDVEGSRPISAIGASQAINSIASEAKSAKGVFLARKREIDRDMVRFGIFCQRANEKGTPLD